jgi:sulfite exporter TauE/SafE
MIEWPLLAISGLVGSSHCLGMCGPFALAIGAASRGRSVMVHQVVYTLGRLFTYAVLGVAAGFAGQRIVTAFPRLMNVPAILAFIAGAYLIYQGLLAAGVFKKWGVSRGAGCGAASVFRSLLTSGALSSVFIAGILTGLLPCGLLYGMLALAASTGDLVHGGATMLIFGLGTAPLMIAAGSAGSLLSLDARKKLFVAAAWCLVLTGGITMVRGASYFDFGGEPPPGCPFCASEQK